MRAGDAIIEVDGIKVDNFTTAEVANAIRGSVDTEVKLKITRGGETIDYDIVRKNIETKNVYGEIIENTIGYMKILQFGYAAGTDFVRAYNSFEGKATGLIIDLRGNGGGELTNTIDIASRFIAEEKAIMWYKGNSSSMREYKSDGDLKIYLPIVLLVDGGSASASEILAAALIEQSAAVAVGEKTFGKGTMQRRRSLSDGSTLYLTVAEFFSPTQKKIAGIGITPEVVVAISDEDYASGSDPQLQTAVSEIRKKQAVKAQSFAAHGAVREKTISLPSVLEGVKDWPATQNFINQGR